MSKSFNTYEVNSDESSYYDSIFLKEGNENNDKVSVNNSKIVLNGKVY